MVIFIIVYVVSKGSGIILGFGDIVVIRWIIFLFLWGVGERSIEIKA